MHAAEVRDAAKRAQQHARVEEAFHAPAQTQQHARQQEGAGATSHAPARTAHPAARTPPHARQQHETFPAAARQEQHARQQPGSADASHDAARTQQHTPGSSAATFRAAAARRLAAKPVRKPAAAVHETRPMA